MCGYVGADGDILDQSFQRTVWLSFFFGWGGKGLVIKIGEYSRVDAYVWGCLCGDWHQVVWYSAGVWA